MRRMASLHAAPPPPPAGRDVASQRVRASHQPVSTCHVHLSPQNTFNIQKAPLFIFWATLLCCSKCETWDYWHFSPCFCKWRQKTVQFCGVYWHALSGPLSKTQWAPTEDTNTHTTRSVSPAEDGPPLSLSHLSGCVSLLYSVRLMLSWIEKSQKMPLLLFFSPSFPRLTLPFCPQVSQRSPSVTSDQSQKSVESLFSARWVFGDWLCIGTSTL